MKNRFYEIFNICPWHIVQTGLWSIKAVKTRQPSSHPLYPSSTKLQANFPPLSSERWQLAGVNTTEMWYLKGNRKIFLIMIIALLTLMATHGSNCDLSNYPLSQHVNIFISSFIPWFICYFTTRKLMGWGHEWIQFTQL